EAKKRLAADIVSFYHGAEAAAAARTGWERRFSDRQDPENTPEVSLPASSLTDGKMQVGQLLVDLRLAAGKNEGRRLVQGGGATVGEQRTKLTDGNALIDVPSGLIVRVGSRKIVRVRLV